MAESATRLYELRLPTVADPRIRGAVLTVLGRWASTPADPGRPERLGHTGVALRLSLGDAEAAALLRDIYATGVAPAGVILRPLHVGVAQPTDEPAFAIFARHGGRFVPTWNWRAFVVGPFWYFRRGLYGKGLALLVLSVCPFFT